MSTEQFKYNVWNKPHHIRLDTVDNSDDSGVDNEKSPSGLKNINQMEGDVYNQSNDAARLTSYNQNNDTLRLASYNQTSDLARVSSYIQSNDEGRVSSYNPSNDITRVPAYIPNNDTARLTSPSREEVIDVVNDKRENGDHEEDYLKKQDLHKHYDDTSENNYSKNQDVLTRYNNIPHEESYVKTHDGDDIYKKPPSVEDYTKNQEIISHHPKPISDEDYVKSQDVQTRHTKTTNEEDYIKSQEVHTYHGKPTHYYRDVPRSDMVLAVKPPRKEMVTNGESEHSRNSSPIHPNRSISQEKMNMDERSVINKLFRDGRCVWPGCDRSFPDKREFVRHLDCYHTLDEKSAAQARVQGYVVRELEEKLAYERTKLSAMLAHLQFTNEKGSYMLQKTAHSLSPPPRGTVNHMPPMMPNTNGSVVLVPYPPPPPPHHMHPLPHMPHIENESHRGTMKSPRERPSSLSPPTSPRRHSNSHNQGLTPTSHPNFTIHKSMHNPFPMPFYAVHPGFPVRPEMLHLKRESPDHDNQTPNDDRRYAPPGLICASSDDMNFPPMIVEAHPPGPPLTGSLHRINDPVSYHPVRRRGEAAAMVDIGHELRTKGSLYQDPDVRPPYTYASLIRQGVLDSPNGELTLNEVYQWFVKNFAYFRKNTSTWKNAVRHNLSLHKCFVRKENHKGAVWTVDDVEFFRRRMTKPGLPKREYFAPMGEMELHPLEGVSNSPPEPEDDFVSDEPLPSMAMDQSMRTECNDVGENDIQDDVFNGPTSIKQRIPDDNYSEDSELHKQTPIVKLEYEEHPMDETMKAYSYNSQRNEYTLSPNESITMVTAS